MIIPDYDEFLTSYTKYNNTNSVSVLQNDMMCVIDNQSTFYLNKTSTMTLFGQAVHIGTFTCFCLLDWCVSHFAIVVIILLVKGVQVCYFSTTTVGYHYFDRTIDGQNTSRFAVSSYVFFQLWFGMALWAFYYLFNIIYNEQHSPCFGGNDWTDLTRSLLTNRMEVHSYQSLVYIKLFYHHHDCLRIRLVEFPPHHCPFQQI